MVELRDVRDEDVEECGRENAAFWQTWMKLKGKPKLVNYIVVPYLVECSFKIDEDAY